MKIRIKSDIAQTKQTKNIYCFFSPCSITKTFCGPIAKINVKPVKKPKKRKDMFKNLIFYQLQNLLK